MGETRKGETDVGGRGHWLWAVAFKGSKTRFGLTFKMDERRERARMKRRRMMVIIMMMMTMMMRHGIRRKQKGKKGKRPLQRG